MIKDKQRVRKLETTQRLMLLQVSCVLRNHQATMLGNSSPLANATGKHCRLSISQSIVFQFLKLLQKQLGN